MILLRERVDAFAEPLAKYNARAGIRSNPYEPDSGASEYVNTTISGHRM